MSIYLEPVNLKQWNMFENVSGPGHVEPFLATKAMEPGDLVLLHVGGQDKRYESGVYAYGTVLSSPYVPNDRPDDYCNGRLSVDVRIDHIQHNAPVITHEDTKLLTGCFRHVCRIRDERQPDALNLLGM